MKTAISFGNQIVNGCQYVDTLQDGLKVIWTMDEPSGISTLDEKSGYWLTSAGITGTINNTANGKLERARDFISRGKYFVASSIGDFITTASAQSITAWIGASDDNVLPVGGTIIARSSDSNHIGMVGHPIFNFKIGISTQTLSYFYETLSFPYYNEIKMELPDFFFSSTWTHVAVTRDNNYLRLYINGEMVKQITNTTGNMYVPTNCTVCANTVGAHLIWESSHSVYVPDQSTLFGGTLDQLAVWDRALTQNEVCTIFRDDAGYHFDNW